MEEGGLAWEQGRAVTRMVDAMRENDLDGMALALADFAAALGTRTTSALSSMLGPMLIDMRRLRNEYEAETRAFEHKLDLLILAVERISDATLAETLSAEMRTELIAQISRIPDLERRVGAIEQSIEKSNEP